MSTKKPQCSVGCLAGLQSRAGVFVLLLTILAGPIGAQSLPPQLRSVVYRYAPYLIHETKHAVIVPRQVDHLLATDFDGNRYGPDNTDNAADANRPNPTATLYYAAAETGTSSDRGYYFITYAWYHAADAGFQFWDSGWHVVDSGHDHDMEGTFFVIKKSPYYPYGVLATAVTEAHGALIPYFNPSSIVYVGNPRGENGWPGYIEYWTDPRYGTWRRPVVALRGSDHGSYMAQDCSGKSPPLDHGYGMWRGSWEDFGTFVACYHDDSDYMLYRPATESQAVFSALSYNTRSGVYDYDLRELVTTTLWEDRMATNAMLTGSAVDLTNGGGYARIAFLNYAQAYQANPLWYWVGGRGICQQPFSPIGPTYCYYSFGYDATANYYAPVDWPANYTPGSLITNPASDAGLRFPALPELQERQCYNPYVSPQILNCASPAPLSLSIQGRNCVTQGLTNTWQAFVSGGTPPYSYVWSGALSGYSDQLVGEIYDVDTDDLFLSVTDAAGQTIYGSVAITVGTTENPC